jgi:hypothetical protein
VADAVDVDVAHRATVEAVLDERVRCVRDVDLIDGRLAQETAKDCTRWCAVLPRLRTQCDVSWSCTDWAAYGTDFRSRRLG